MRRAAAVERSSLQRLGDLRRALAQAREVRVGLVQQLQGLLVRRNERLQRCRGVGQPLDRLLEAFDRVSRPYRHDAAAATRPSTPLTNRPASSPENVLASSIDSLMAALV